MIVVMVILACFFLSLLFAQLLIPKLDKLLDWLSLVEYRAELKRRRKQREANEWAIDLDVLSCKGMMGKRVLDAPKKRSWLYHRYWETKADVCKPLAK